MSQAEALEYFRANSGYARMKDLKQRGIHPRVLKTFLNQGVVEKIKPGVYKLTDYHASEHQNLVDLCVAVPRGVVCIYSALNYYGLSDYAPDRVMVGVPQGYRVPRIAGERMQAFFFSGGLYDTDIEEVTLEEGSFRIYSREKALVDAFRFRKRFGLKRAENALRRYAAGRHRHLGRLLTLAGQCRVLNVMLPYLDGVM